jgi:hypothetical protein
MGKWNIIEIEYKPRSVETIVATRPTQDEAMREAMALAQARSATRALPGLEALGNQADGRIVIAYKVEED